MGECLLCRSARGWHLIVGVHKFSALFKDAHDVVGTTGAIGVSVLHFPRTSPLYRLYAKTLPRVHLRIRVGAFDISSMGVDTVLYAPSMNAGIKVLLMVPYG